MNTPIPILRALHTAIDAEKERDTTPARTWAPDDICIGGTYRTKVATWTVEDISPCGMLSLRREDGRTARFGRSDFASWVIEEISAARPDDLREALGLLRRWMLTGVYRVAPNILAALHGQERAELIGETLALLERKGAHHD